jgi:dCTP deaminase
MILSDRDIKKAIKNKELKIEGVKDLYIGPSSIDLHLRGIAKQLIDKGVMIDTRRKNSITFNEFAFETILLSPGEFYLVSTKEILTLGDSIVGFIQGRSSLGRIGLNIHAAGFFDAGFSGSATLELTNFTNRPILLYEGMRICQMVFARTISPSEIPYSKKKDAKYQGQVKPEQSKIYEEN